MSLILHLKIPGAIIAASDCRITGTEQLFIDGGASNTGEGTRRVNLGRLEELMLLRKDQLPEGSVKIPCGQYHFTNTDSEQKTFLLVNDQGNSFAVSYCGAAALLGTPASFQMRRALSGMKDAKTTQEVAERFTAFWTERRINNAPGVLISGFNGDTPSVIEVKNDGSAWFEHFEDPASYGVIYHGEKEVIKALTGLGNFQWNLFRPEDAVNFCDLMITTTARIQSFQSRQQTVSEEYDLLLITEGKGQWIKRHTMEF